MHRVHIHAKESLFGFRYRRAGMEALFGYLYLSGRIDRVRELFAAATRS